MATSRSPLRGSRLLGGVMLAASLGVLAACTVAPPTSPRDPAIPETASAMPSFSSLAPPPTTNGPTTPPVPTTAPGTFSYGDTITLHTERGSTWEITATGTIDPADSLAAQTGAIPPSGQRFVILELEIENVGVITTHPFHDMTFAYQPQNAPMYDQNTASTAAAPEDLGYIAEMYPGQREVAQVIVAVPASAPEGAWLLSGDGFDTVYRFQ